MLKTTEIENKLERLRTEWRLNPDKRKIIELRARALKVALNGLNEKLSLSEKGSSDLVKKAEEVFESKAELLTLADIQKIGQQPY